MGYIENYTEEQFNTALCDEFWRLVNELEASYDCEYFYNHETETNCFSIKDREVHISDNQILSHFNVDKLIEIPISSIVEYCRAEIIRKLYCN